MTEKELFDQVCFQTSKAVTKNYSTSFSSAVRMLSPSIRTDIHNIYGFVRFADEIVDSFHDYDKEYLLNKFEDDLFEALEMKISLNPVLNSFQITVHKYNIDYSLLNSFLQSMRADLSKNNYTDIDEYNKYIYGSADVVGLMCLKVFVGGDDVKYNELKSTAMKLGSAFQKVNFLRDLKSDMEILNRSYFPSVDFKNITTKEKNEVIRDIQNDFEAALVGIKKLPTSARFGVYTAYIYYSKLLRKLEKTSSENLLNKRVRVPNPVKFGLMAKCYVNYRFNLL